MSKAALSIPPMTLEEIEARLTLFTKWGVAEAEFYGPHLTKVQFASATPAAPAPDDTPAEPELESEADQAAPRLATGSAKVRGNAEHS